MSIRDSIEVGLLVEDTPSCHSALSSLDLLDSDLVDLLVEDAPSCHSALNSLDLFDSDVLHSNEIAQYGESSSDESESGSDVFHSIEVGLLVEDAPSCHSAQNLLDLFDSDLLHSIEIAQYAESLTDESESGSDVFHSIEVGLLVEDVPKRYYPLSATDQLDADLLNSIDMADYAEGLSDESDSNSDMFPSIGVGLCD
ncbi:Structure-specific endonuclease subunit SLX4 [Gossypium arboreum]|uniref:Structure-specific endonuclease subunit SLX4 n=1 Tax=Gossypium arboreum TaxID=29729 RepID=A0A0B0N6R1_GOSAR|nr:Structure-specific endonuclease subunit SLX4 [Gossypium arboreum]